ncbi:MAG TPA: ABC transporter substrate-binding protein [Methanocorpusculum sp.]|nr:ABC transporter substrate-binding protein [Methanocorpusculum sp.]
MKKTAVLTILLVFAVLLISSGCVAEQQTPSTGEKYIIGIDDYAPWTYYENGKPTGLDIEAAQWVAKNQGFDTEFRLIKWDEKEAELNNGTIDIIWSGLSVTPGREKDMTFTDTYWTDTLSAASRKDAGLTLDDFFSGKYTIAVQKACTADDELPRILGEEKYQQMQNAGKIKNEYATFAESMQTVSEGKADFAVQNTLGINDYIKSDRTLQNIGVIDENGEKYAAAVKKGNTKLLETLNKGIAALKKSQDWQYMQIKYGFAKSYAAGH